MLFFYYFYYVFEFLLQHAFSKMLEELYLTCIVTVSLWKSFGERPLYPSTCFMFSSPPSPLGNLYRFTET